MIRTYLDWILELPWPVTTEDRLDPVEARRVLDDDHYDLDKVKERIVEYLAVRKLKGDMKGPILCFVGPPGVGKTSLGQSIARAMNAEVRAHLARRRARRGGDSRPSPHLHRLDSRTDRAGAQAGRLDEPGVHARRDRQDVRRLPGRPGGGAARGARPGAEPLVPRPLPRDPGRSVARALHRDLEPARHRPPGAARPHGDHPAGGLHRGGEGAHRAALPAAPPDERARPAPGGR